MADSLKRLLKGSGEVQGGKKGVTVPYARRFQRTDSHWMLPCGKTYDSQFLGNPCPHQVAMLGGSMSPWDTSTEGMARRWFGSIHHPTLKHCLIGRTREYLLQVGTCRLPETNRDFSGWSVLGRKAVLPAGRVSPK